MEKALPAIPAKRYFTIGEVSELCGVKPYVLRYWEQEFTQLKPMKRRGNRRYYQHHEVLLIRRIRELLYEQGFTISGARNRLTELSHAQHAAHGVEPVVELSEAMPDLDNGHEVETAVIDEAPASERPKLEGNTAQTASTSLAHMRQELLSIRQMLTV